jgi:hypothetical protein
VLPYRVECNDRNDGPVVIRMALTTAIVGGFLTAVPWLPRIGSTYRINALEFDPGAFLINCDYTQVHGANNPNSTAWRVDLNYGPYDAGLFGQDPTRWPTRVTFNGNKFERAVLIDQAGNPILNSATVPFSEPITIDDTRTTITVIRNEWIRPNFGSAGWNFQLSATYRDGVNQYAWNGFAPKTVKCGTISTSDPQYDSNSQSWYYEVTYPFEVNLDTWTKQPLDRGYQVLVSGLPVPKLTSTGQQVDEPVLLDGSGNELPSGGTPVFLPFDAYKLLDFSGLNINFLAVLGLT